MDAQVYKRAAEIIDQGWTQFDLVRDNRDGSKSYCAVGALRKALGFRVVNPVVSVWSRVADNTVSEYSRVLVEDVLNMDLFGDRDYPYWLSRFNDNPARSKDDVVAAMLAAAYLVETRVV